MGGPLAVSDAVVAQLEALDVSVLRVSGADTTGSALEAADVEMSIAGLGWSPEPGLVVARGDGYTDGLAGALVAAGEGPVGGRGPEPLVLTETPTSVGPYLGCSGRRGRRRQRRQRACGDLAHDPGRRPGDHDAAVRTMLNVLSRR